MIKITSRNLNVFMILFCFKQILLFPSKPPTIVLFCHLNESVFQIGICRRDIHFCHGEVFKIYTKLTISIFQLSEIFLSVVLSPNQSIFPSSLKFKTVIRLQITYCLAWQEWLALSPACRSPSHCLMTNLSSICFHFCTASSVWLMSRSAQLWIFWFIFIYPNFQSLSETPQLSRVVTLATLCSQCRSGFIQKVIWVWKVSIKSLKNNFSTIKLLYALSSSSKRSFVGL